MLQRLQSIYLFVAAALLVAFAFTTSVTVATGAGVYNLGVLYSGIADQVAPNYLLMVMDILIVVLSLITIFKYKNLANQLRLCSITIALAVAMMVSIGVLAYGQMSLGAVTFTVFNALPVGALVMLLLARCGIARDKKLISDSERIR